MLACVPPRPPPQLFIAVMMTITICELVRKK